MHLYFKNAPVLQKNALVLQKNAPVLQTNAPVLQKCTFTSKTHLYFMANPVKMPPIMSPIPPRTVRNAVKGKSNDKLTTATNEISYK